MFFILLFMKSTCISLKKKKTLEKLFHRYWKSCTSVTKLILEVCLAECKMMSLKTIYDGVSV